MTTSGTVNQTQYPVNKIIEQACRRCGVPTPAINAEMLQVGRDNLYLLLTSLGNRGINLWEVKEAVLTLIPDIQVYELENGAVDLLNIVYRSTADLDTVMSPISRDDWTSFPNKQTTGSPILYWFDRQIRPRVTLWPVPVSPFTQGIIVYWYHRQIEDVGAYTNTLDIPPRWTNTVVTGLAALMAMELPGVDAGRIGMLQTMAAQALAEAEAEETDGAPIRIIADVTAYTR